MTAETKVVCAVCAAAVPERLALMSYSGSRYCSWRCAERRNNATADTTAVAHTYVVSLRVDTASVADEARKALDAVRSRFGIGHAVEVVRRRDR